MNKSLKEAAENLLNRFVLKRTELRIHLIGLFLKEKKSFSQAEIIQQIEKIAGSVDRVSIYRNLNQLKTAGIIHEIENNKYVCCTHDCGKHAHVLLYCQTCENHTEIKDHEKLGSFFKAMGSFQFLSSNQAVFMKGICQDCAS